MKKLEQLILETAKTVLGEVDTAGRSFYTPKEWKDRGERYGLQSELIVVHDGGDLASFFNPDYGSWKLQSAMDAALEKVGYYAEPCTSWYTAIYKM
jgi:hypothetical protein